MVSHGKLCVVLNKPVLSLSESIVFLGKSMPLESNRWFCIVEHEFCFINLWFFGKQGVLVTPMLSNNNGQGYQKEAS